MSVTAHVRGRLVIWDGTDWRDEGGNLASGYSGGDEWPCVRCGVVADVDDGVGGADPCLGVLEDVKFACCGHGVEPGYQVTTEGVYTTCAL